MIPRIDDPRHTCLTCDWFRFPSLEDYEKAKAEGRLPPLRNRGCKSPLPIEVKDGECIRWRNCYSVGDRLKAALHIKRLKRRSIIR